MPLLSLLAEEFPEESLPPTLLPLVALLVLLTVLLVSLLPQAAQALGRRIADKHTAPHLVFIPRRYQPCEAV